MKPSRTGTRYFLPVTFRRHRVKPVASAGTAAADTFDTHPGAGRWAVPDQGIRHIFGAGRPEAASLPNIGRQGQFVRPQSGANGSLIKTGHAEIEPGLRQKMPHNTVLTRTLPRTHDYIRTYFGGESNPRNEGIMLQCRNSDTFSTAVRNHARTLWMASTVASKASRVEAWRAGKSLTLLSI